ncbi:MAG TPA: protein kinase [Terriglobales bacterium]|nr:protein kinase [Terriglobales bacterium]
MQATLSHYRVLEQVGAGGMGVVYRAHDERLDRDVALKVLPAGVLADEAARKRFRKEALALSKLNHPNIATVHDFDTQDGTDFLVTEYIPGLTLDSMLASGPLPQKEVVRLGIQMAEGLAAAHEQGIVHRDLKPANIRVTPDVRLKILDFGLARILHPDLTPTAVTADSLTETKAVIGTLPYMSPEQLRGRPADARSDVWAFGVVLYEMAAGVRPFRGETGFELSSAILSQPPPPLPSQVPMELQAVIGRCLQREPARRYQRAGELRAVLEAIQSGTVAPWASLRLRLARRLWLVLFAVLVLMAAVLAGLDAGGLRSRLLGKTATPMRTIRLAVLPFANLTGDPQQEYLSDGLTQELIAQLGRLHPGSLSVIARTSVMRYKQTDKPVDLIGRELGVDYILEGSARREASRVRITAELIQVRDQTQLWAETYERELAGIMALQNEVARKVAGSLTITLLPGERARLANVRVVNPEAYEAYLQGLHHFYKLTPGDLDSAQQYYELALQKDPNFALAYTGLALVWAGRNQMGIMSPTEAAPKANAAALKAVALDDTLAEAHYALAAVKTWQVWDLPGAQPEWKRAIELNPNFPDARAFYSHYLSIMGRPQEAEPQILRALELDPFNAFFQSLYAMDLLYLRRYDDAIAQARKALRTAPDAPVAHNALWIGLFLKGMYKEAFLEAKANFPGDRELEEAFDRGYAEGGYPLAMRRGADLLAARSRKAYVSPTFVAGLYLAAGDKDLTLQWLEKAFEVREPNLPYIGTPDYDSVRSDPRFQDLLRRMKLPR